MERPGKFWTLQVLMGLNGPMVHVCATHAEHIHSRYLLQFQACQEEVGRAQEAEMEKSKVDTLTTAIHSLFVYLLVCGWLLFRTSLIPRPPQT